jgi:hypothetical protein
VITVGTATLAVSPVTWTHHQYWLLAAALLTIPGHLRIITTTWRAAVDTHLLLALACIALTAHLACGPAPDPPGWRQPVTPVPARADPGTYR